MSRKKTAVLGLAALTVLAQFYPTRKPGNPSTAKEVAAPAEVREILVRSCYDCHSNETRWPWYSHVAPASWLVARDVGAGRQRMNFSRWPERPSPVIECYFGERIAERVGSREMPPLPYRLLHPSASLDEEDVTLLRRWAASQCPETVENRKDGPDSSIRKEGPIPP